MKFIGLSLALPLLLAPFASGQGGCEAPPTETKLTFFDSVVSQNTLHEIGGLLRFDSKSTGAVLSVAVHINYCLWLKPHLG
jgi:hypothetical protein